MIGATVTNDTSITPTQVQFYTDEVTAFQANDGEVYAAANKVLRNIGFNEDRVKAIRKKWRDDRVVSTKGRYFTLRYSSGIQPVDKDTYCLSIKILPLALAKISITPELEKSYPEAVEKLIRYQLECADVLYKHFLGNEDTVVTDPRVNEPISGEDVMQHLMLFTNSWSIFAEDVTTAINEMMDAISSLMSTTNALSGKFDDYANNVIKSPRIETTVDGEKEWIQKVWTSAGLISRKTGRSKVASLREAYSIVRRDGVDLTGMYKQYKIDHPGIAQINMCAKSTDLRAHIESAMKELHRKYYPHLYSSTAKPAKKVYKSQLFISTPPEIRAIIEKSVAKSDGLVYSQGAKQIYKEIEHRTGGNLTEEAKAYARDHGYRNCSKAYFISVTDKYFNALKQIAGV